MQQQWLKQFVSAGRIFEIFFDPIGLKVISREKQGEQFIEKATECTDPISGIYAYGRILNELKQQCKDLTYVVPEGVNVAASRELAELVDDQQVPASTAYERIASLLDQGADVNLGSFSYGQALLSVTGSDISISKLLIERGAAIDVMEYQLTWYYYPGATPLHKAILKSSMDLASLLRDAGANLEFHFHIALQMALVDINAHAQMGWKSKDISEQHKKTWGTVIDTLIGWGVRRTAQCEALEQLLKQEEVPYLKSIQSLLDFSKADWLDQSRALAETLSTVQKDKFISIVMGQPGALQRPDWATVMAFLIEEQPAFEEVAEDVYGSRVSQADDEGWLCQGWNSGNYSNISSLLGLLKKKPVTQHPAWFTIVKKLIDDHEQYDSDLHAIRSFLANGAPKAHAQQPALMKLLEEHL